MSDILTPQKVNDTFMFCLFKDDEPKTTYLPAPGITTNIGFHPGRIAEKRADIVAMLDELPVQFKEESAGGGGGWSFLQACEDKHGNQWTGMHRTMEQLFQLGIAAGVASYLMPREMWAMLPGGMPYIVVHAQPKVIEEVPIAA